jgi:hypothetical protein
MRDEWYGHRNPLTGEELGDRTEWISWDFALLDAFQTIEDYTDDSSGVPIWELMDEEVDVQANRKINPFLAARDNKTKGTATKPYKPQAGEYFVPVIVSLRPDGHIQTYSEWLKKQAESGNE